MILDWSHLQQEEVGSSDNRTDTGKRVERRRMMDRYLMPNAELPNAKCRIPNAECQLPNGEPRTYNGNLSEIVIFDFFIYLHV